MRMPALETERLRIREFTPDDLEAVHRLLDVELSSGLSQAERRRWLEWTASSYEQLANLKQPPYGDRAILVRSTHELVGACGLVPCLGPFDGSERSYPEVGMFWAVSPAHQRRGYAAEAARALVEYAFSVLRLRRLIALTSYDNVASIGVMRKLGMRIERNPRPEPAWLQVIGSLTTTQQP